jgi:hypothetical protein
MTTETLTKGRPFVAVRSDKQPRMEEQLAEHGAPVYLFDWDQRPRAFETERMLDRVIEQLKAREFDPERDALVLSGQLVYVSVLLAAALMEHGRVNLLVFDAVNERYVARSMGKKT